MGTFLVCLAGRTTVGQAVDRSRPFFDARSQQTEYVGPSGTTRGPQDIDAVLIGYFGPDDPEHPLAGQMWQAATLAIQHANQQGGWQGKPFRLRSVWSENPWGTGVKDLTRMIYQDHPWAIVGGVDGPSTHLAEQVVAKARLALVSPVSTDKTVNLANVPWMFSLAPHDQQLAAALVPHVLAAPAEKPPLLISQNDHDSRLQAMEVVKQLTARHATPQFQLKYDGNDKHLAPLVRQALQHEPTSVVVIAQPPAAARLVVALRSQGFEGPIFGGTACGSATFRQMAGNRADGVVFPLLADPHPSPSLESEKGIAHADSREPRPPIADWDDPAILTYDAVQMVTRAIRHAGLNRAGIGAALRELAPWNGAAGRVQWDGLGSNTRVPQVGRIRQGRVVPLPNLQPQ